MAEVKFIGVFRSHADYLAACETRTQQGCSAEVTCCGLGSVGAVKESQKFSLLGILSCRGSETARAE